MTLGQKSPSEKGKKKFLRYFRQAARDSNGGKKICV